VELASADDPWIAGVTSHYESLEREKDVILGFGAHLDTRIALSRAFTELNQMLPTARETRELRRRRLLPDFAEAVCWWDEATLASEPYLVPSPDVPPVALPMPGGAKATFATTSSSVWIEPPGSGATSWSTTSPGPPWVSPWPR